MAGRPFGVMLVGPAGTDERLARIAALLTPPDPRLAVVGAHLTGQPLNPQLLALGAPVGRHDHHRPGLPPVRAAHRAAQAGPGPRGQQTGRPIEAEIWELPPEGLGALTAALPRPMALGRVELADGTTAPGFLCEPAALDGAEDITAYGGWRAYRNS